MLFSIFVLGTLFSCIEGLYPKPTVRFEADPKHDKDGDGFTENDGDSDDGNPLIYPGNAQFEPITSCVLDYDADGFGDATAEAPYDKGSDCDDSSADIKFASDKGLGGVYRGESLHL